MRLPSYEDLSKEQDRINNLPLDGSFLVTGPPGTGKTVMALYRASVLQSKKRHVSLLMHSRLLTKYTTSATEELLIDGSVQIDGVDSICMTLSPEEIFFRALRHAEFDICELSLSSSTVKTAQGDFAYVGVPAFVSRAFRHTSIYVRKDRIAGPQDLKGKRIGVAEYQLTANVWARALLADHGVSPSDVVWVRGGLEEPGRQEKVAVALPPAIRLEAAPDGATLSGLLAQGAIDGVISPRAPTPFDHGHRDVGCYRGLPKQEENSKGLARTPNCGTASSFPRGNAQHTPQRSCQGAAFAKSAATNH
jgi:hypothetical protein